MSAPVTAGPTATPRVAAALWPLALLTYLHAVFVALDTPVDGDFRILHRAAVAFLHGREVYSDPEYVFPPSGLLLTSPLGWMGHDTSRVVFLLLGAVLAPVAGAGALRLMGRSWTGPAGVAVLFGLAISETVTSTLNLGNLNTVLAALEVAALLLLLRRRDTPAGLVLGLAIAVKPVMGLLVLLPILRRRWRCAAVTAAVPVALNAVALPLIAAPEQFFRITVPNLLHARPGANSSLWASGTYLGTDPGVIVLVRCLVVAAAAFVLWRLRHERDSQVWLGTVSGALLLATFLAASLSEMYWSVLLLPLLLTALRPASPMHNPVAWVGVYLFATTDQWTPRGSTKISADYVQLRPTAGWLVLLLVLAGWAARRPAEP